jgi:PilZ domain-containing protein
MYDPETDQKVLAGEMPEPRRKLPRHRVLKGAHITFRSHQATIDCTVRNLSEKGACLKVQSPIGIPDDFDLVLNSKSVVHCRVTWRKATQIGVEFD